jgi:glycyl-tRNA synthetase beta chain
MLGSFDPDFLDVPEEVIQLSARTNQKYFVMRDGAGKLAPHFVCTANIVANDGGAAIVAGNERVLAARLSDARFFWQQDVKVPLAEQATKLAGIVFHEKLGTVADKVERVAKLARWLVEQGIVKADGGVAPDVLADEAERAARLAKADLVTGMVGEFPELQGVIGGYLARAQGEPDAVADAVRDHYKPVGQGDAVPTAPVTVAVAFADKIDSLQQFFGANMQPTGSKDPFALRRAALGVLALMVENDLRYPVGAAQGLFDFLADRLKVQQREAGIRHDLIDAAVALGGEDLFVRLLARVTALQAFVETGEGTNLLAGYKRAANILKKENWDLPRVMATRGEQGIPQTGEEDPLSLVEEPAIAAAVAQMAQGSAAPSDAPAEEAALTEALDLSEPRATAAIAVEDFTAAMAALASLRAPIDAFFDKVIVNDADQDVRKRRLNLLARFRDAVHRVADFSRIEG